MTQSTGGLGRSKSPYESQGIANMLIANCKTSYNSGLRQGDMLWLCKCGGLKINKHFSKEVKFELGHERVPKAENGLGGGWVKGNPG